MEHRILQSRVDEFCTSSQIGNLPDHKRFEYFSNYTIISQLHPEAFSEIASIADIDVDRSGTFGIDAIAVVVNNNIVRTTEDIDILAKSNNIEAKILFIQSKTSKSVDSGDVLKFIEASKMFLVDPEKFAGDENLNQSAELLQYLFSSKIARWHSSTSPTCAMAYAYSGAQPPDPFVEQLVAQRCAELSDSVRDFKIFDFKFWNAEELIRTYKEVENQFEVEIRFKNNLPLDVIAGVEQAYVGYIDAPELMKLVTDPSGDIRRNVFYDNVRDFQGVDNSVNTEIATTVNDRDSVGRFVLYNNGITIVASFLKNLGANRFLLRNYQVVNGCQTSNVLFLNRNAPGFDRVSIPIKIAHTDDGEVVGQIIRANNRQTPVPTEAFVALERWHKDLQEYVSIESKKLGENLFYERRSREYTLINQAPEKKRIIGLHGMIRAFTAAYLQRPHMVIANNPTEIMRNRGDHLFNSTHKHAPYLASAMLMYKLHSHLNDRQFDAFFHRHRYHVAMLITGGINKSFKLPEPNSKKAVDLSDSILEFCMDGARFADALSTAQQFVADVHQQFINSRGYNARNPPLRSVEFSEYLIQAFASA